MLGGSRLAERWRESSLNAEQGGRSQHRRPLNLPRHLLKPPAAPAPGQETQTMSLYADLALQDSIKEQLFRCKLHMLERKCCSGVEKLKALIGEHLHSGTPVADILEKTKSLLTLRKALLSHSGYSKYSREILRLFPDAEDDLAPLCC